MIIKGLQKLTLLDYPGKVACTVFTGWCNFRCPFCQNSELVISPALNRTIPDREIFDYLNKRSGMLDGICITGGEPLVQEDLIQFIEKCKQLGYLVKLDTNGYLSDKLAEILYLGIVDYVAMDIKAAPENYPRLTGVADLDIKPILESVNLLKECGLPHEFRTTVVGDMHTADDFVKIADWLEGEEKYFLQKFVDSGAIIEGGHKAPSDDTMREYLEIVQKKIPGAELRGVE
ncbi:MAG: anaerobic ribonucleoside-triphosphate reductase activating protein [Clostridia bacterium]|nr:anaerobic ribonucleoside-triphosphate reductase activating protein [Clostridia bacterium]